MGERLSYPPLALTRFREMAPQSAIATPRDETDLAKCWRRQIQK
jgi:hypothetical protein